MVEQKNMLVQTLVRLSALTIGFESSCPMATDQKFQMALFSINYRWPQLELVAQRTSDDAEQLIKAREGDIEPESFELLAAETALDIETFYVVMHSLMEDIAALTPYFYPKGPKKPASHSFDDQIEWYKKHTDFDPPMTEYLTNNLGWFDELKDVRDELLHRQAQVLPINTTLNEKQGEFQVQFDILKKGFDPMLGMPHLMSKLQATLRNLLEFLGFYSGHFKDRIPKDWPSYKDIGGASPKGAVHGLKLLKRWAEETPI